MTPSRRLPRSARGAFFAWVSVAFLTCGVPAAQDEDGREPPAREADRAQFPQHAGAVDWQDRVYDDGRRVGDLVGNIAADRDLDAQDRDYVATLSDYLIDGSNDWLWRETAAERLGDCGHRSGLPALLAVVRDEEENEDVRRAAVRALTFVRDPRVVGYVVEAVLAKPSPKNLVFEALDDLAQFSGIPPELAAPKRLPPVLPPPEDEADRRKYAETWLRWWAAQGDAPPLNRMHRFSLN